MSKLDDLMNECAREFLPAAKVTPVDHEHERLRQFFFGENEVKDGKCPICWAEGRIHLSTFICEIHGEFK